MGSVIYILHVGKKDFSGSFKGSWKAIGESLEINLGAKSLSDRVVYHYVFCALTKY